MARRRAAARLAVAAACVLLTAASPPPEPWFEEVAAGSGLDFVHHTGATGGFWFPEIMAGGAAWCDYDGDGWLDLYLVQAGSLQPDGAPPPGNRLYRNRGDGRFEDVTALAGVGDRGYGMGAACADYDGDGDVDLYVTNVGPNVLFRNRGDGRFERVAAGDGAADPAWSTSAAFVDVDADADLDLYVVNYVHWAPERELRCGSGARPRDYCQPANYRAPSRDSLFRNDGGRFVDVSEAAGLATAFGNGLGVISGELGGDRLPDLYVANDGDPNQLWINLGGGRFEDRALSSGLAVNMTGASEAGMGVVAADLDDDGDEELVLTHLRGETHTVYRNDGGNFLDVTLLTGLAAGSLPFTGFGAGAADFDHDGRLDLYVANGRVGATLQPYDAARPYAEPDQLFRGLGGGRFAEVEPRGGAGPLPPANSRAAAFADYDNDGDVDLAVVDNGGPVRLLRNRAGHREAWLELRLAGEPAGTRLRLRTAAGDRWRTARSAYGYCSANDPRVHFGLGSPASADELSVHWTGGHRRLLRSPATGRILVVPR